MNPESSSKEDLICLNCQAKGAIHKRKNTAYANDKMNWDTLCDICWEKDNAHWQERWDEYHSSVL